MPYVAEINRKNPSCMLFLIDQSGSMDEPIAGSGGARKKSHAVADVINRILQDLVIKCSRGNEVRDFYEIGVIGYHSDQNGNPQVEPAFAGALKGRTLAPVSQVEANPARMEKRPKKEKEFDGAGGNREIVVDVTFAVWFDAVATGNTPMCEAFRQAAGVLLEWIGSHPESFPPIVVNITDGEATDGDPTADAEKVTSLATRDGNVLLFNCHISKEDHKPITFPESEDSLPNENAKRMFRISSPLPESFRKVAASREYQLGLGARAFAYNANLVEMVEFLDIGTRQNPNLR